MIVTPAEMRAIEQAVFTAGSTTAEALMDWVGSAAAQALMELGGWGQADLLVYAGRGNNAGDAFVAAQEFRRLRDVHGGARPFRVRLAQAAGERLGELAQKKLGALPEDQFPREPVVPGQRLPHGASNLFILDGLLGIGARGPLREPIRTAAREINELRRRHGARVISLDVPTGLDAETGAADPDTVVADLTLTVGFVKTGLLADHAANFVGRLRVLEFAELTDAAKNLAADAPGRGELLTVETLAGLLPPRPFDAHKGMFGRVGILAGSVGATGAAVMCSHACARAGAGLITLLAQPDVYPTLAAAASPEVMVKPLPSPLDALDMGFDVLALGPGLGQQGADRVRELIACWPKPMAVDADGLNALAEDLSPLLAPGAGPRLLTPHPGEMARLRKGAGFEKKLTRAETVREFTDRYPVALLLKGARTVIGERGRPPAFNSTGNPGMGTGGMGDVLTGICAALLGQKLVGFDAGRLGAWLHGRAADLALVGPGAPSEESLLPTDLFRRLGAAFRELRRGTS